MDFITQNLLGAVAGHAAVGRPRADGGLGRVALLAGSLGGAVPDFDFLLRPLADPALPFELHRHFTHALVFIPVAGLVATLPFLPFRAGRRSFPRIFAAATIGAATHGLLDNLTSYGTHLLWPFVGHRTSWDSMSIIDPIFTCVLLLGVLAALIRGRPRATRIAMSLALAYIAFGFVQHGRAMDAQRAIARERGHEIENGRAMPTLGNYVVFRSLYEAEGQLWADAVRVAPFGSVSVRDGTSMPRFTEDDLPADTPAHAREVFRGMEAFATGFLGRVEGAGSASDLVLGDMRISLATDGFRPLWGIAIDADGNPATWNSFEERRAAMDGLFERLLDDVIEGDTGFRAVQ